MKKLILLVLLAASFVSVNAQQSYIGKWFSIYQQGSYGKGSATQPHSSSWLEIGNMHTTKAILMPRVDDTSDVTGAVIGDFAFFLADSSMYYYTNHWVKVGSGGVTAPSWQQVTDVGATTNHQLTILAASSPSTNPEMLIGKNFLQSVTMGGTGTYKFWMDYTNGMGVGSLNAGTGQRVALWTDFNDSSQVQFGNNGLGTQGVLEPIGGLGANIWWKLPVYKSGTLAYKSQVDSVAGLGRVTSITAGTGLSGGTITTSGTISMPNTGTAGTYGSSTAYPIITTDAQGRVTTVTTQTVSVGGSGIQAVATGSLLSYTVTGSTPNIITYTPSVTGVFRITLSVLYRARSTSHSDQYHFYTQYTDVDNNVQFNGQMSYVVHGGSSSPSDVEEFIFGDSPLGGYYFIPMIIRAKSGAAITITMGAGGPLGAYNMDMVATIEQLQ